MRLVAIPFALAVLIVGTASATLEQSDFDIVAFKWNTGESVSDTAFGVHASPSPVLDGAVNFMLRDRTLPFYLDQGPDGGGTVLFGLADEAAWTPTNGDGRDLSTQFDTVGNRVYASVDGTGAMQLLLAKDLTAPIVLDSTSVTLDPDTPFLLRRRGGLVEVYYGDDLVMEGSIAQTRDGVDPATIGDDLVISVLAGPTQTGTATLNNLAHDPMVEIADPPRVLRRHAPVGIDQYIATGIDVVLAGEVSLLALPLVNQGAAPATGIYAHLVPESGSGLVINGPATASYGTLPPGAGATHLFTLDATAATPGVYTLTAEVTGGVTASIDTAVAVWGASATLNDASTGDADVVLTTPFGTRTSSHLAPEVVVDPALPYWFDDHSLEETVVLAEPFYGVHWGDAWFADPVYQGPAFVTADTVTLQVSVKFRSGTAFPGCRVEVWADGALLSTKTSDSSGNASFTGLPPGFLKVYVWPPDHLRSTYKNPDSKGDFYEPGSYTLTSKFPDLPSTVRSKPPANAQGQAGGQGAGKPKGTAKSKHRTTGRSVGNALGAGLVTGLVDAAGAFGSPLGAWVLSSLGTVAASTVAAAKTDPVDQDVFYFGEEQTPTASPDELTLQESLVMTSTTAPAAAWAEPVMATTSYTFTRVTDADTYVYNGGETVTLSRYLPLTMAVEKASVGERVIRVTVQKPDLTLLPGPDALVMAYLYDADGSLITELVLNDDGQGDDAAALDAVYTGRASTAGVEATDTTIVAATWSGFSQTTVPSYLGFASDALLHDGFESGATNRWSLAVGAP